VEALGSISEKNRDLVPTLIASLKDRDFEVARKASHVLQALGPDMIPDLVKYVDRSSPDALRHAAYAIGPIGAMGKAAVPMLTAALRQENWATRRAAAEALTRIGRDAQAAVPAMVAVLGRALEEKEVIEEIERFAPQAKAKGDGDNPFGKGNSEAPNKVKGGKGPTGGGFEKKDPADPNEVFDQLARNRPYFLISDAPTQMRNPLMAFARERQLTSEQITRDQFGVFYPNQEQYRALAAAIIRGDAAKAGGSFNVISGRPRHLAMELLDDLLLIDPQVKSALPEGLMDAGQLRTRSGINMQAPLALWKQAHDALAKRYPHSPPFNPLGLTPLPDAPNEGGKQNAAASEPVYKGRPAAFWLEQFKDRDPSHMAEGRTDHSGPGRGAHRYE
jgi:hypothetical protein